MALANLIVLNRKVSAAAATPPLTEACVLSTCLREVRIGMLPPREQPTRAQAEAAGYDRHAGAEAYGFLLQLACGLESEIPGETEILGQIKQAWRDYETTEAARALRPWMQRLLQDTKEIRSEHVTSLGSATYGSLVRRLLGSDLAGPTLLIGAGQLSEAILPFLDSGEVMVWNRSQERGAALLARQRAGASGRVHLLDSTLEAENAAWCSARDVILCIPADETRDAGRVRLWQQHGTTEGRVLHLGIDGVAGTAWETLPGVFTLRDLFNLRDTHALQREAQLARARRACRDKAQLARLDDADGSRTGSSNHGWEDLAVFQASSH
jgi:glutamyl-tRNA reductase